MDIIVKGVVIASLSLLIVALVLVATNADPDLKRVEYYRGVYDVCTGISTNPESCAHTIEKFSRSGWYEKDSPGWNPGYVMDRVPAPTPTQRVTRTPELTATDR